MKGGVKDPRVGGWGTCVVVGGGAVGVCTVQRLVVIKHRVVPALPCIGQDMVPLLLLLGGCSTGQLCGEEAEFVGIR